MLKVFVGVYLALGLLYQYGVYGDASVLAVGTMVHVVFWLIFLLATSFWYLLLAALFCLGIAIIYFILTNRGVIREVMDKRNNPAPIPTYPDNSP